MTHTLADTGCSSKVHNVDGQRIKLKNYNKCTTTIRVPLILAIIYDDKQFG